MTKNINKLALAIILGLGISQVNAQPYQNYRSSKDYTTQIDSSRNNLIQDFKVDMPNLEPGQVIRFYVDGEPRARAVVKFNSSGKFFREVALSETESGRYTGSYTIRSVDELDEKTFSLSLTKGKTVSTASYRPMYVSGNSNRYENKYENRYENRYDNKSDRYEQPRQLYKNPDFGTVTKVDIQDAHPDQINMGSAAIGAVVGGLLGNQVGGGSGRKAATVIGAIGGGALGNQVGKNVGTQDKIWNVSVQFQDGQTSVYQYPNDPQVAVGTNVKKEAGGIVRR